MHVLFLVHGMGKQSENWAEPVIGNLKTIAAQYKRLSEDTFEKDLVFEPIRYDHVFDDLINRWRNDFSGIAESEASSLFPGSKIGELLKSMDKEERSFFWSHVADVLIYRFFPLYRDRVRIDVIHQISKKISHYRAQNPGTVRFSFLAHSLGTAVIHDSLHQLGSTKWHNEIDNVKGPPHTRFQALFMLSNTSKILESDINPDESIVCPVGSRGDKNLEYLDQYINVLHTYDPVTFIRRYKPKITGNNYRQIEVSHIRGANIHDFAHYLDHPAVHIPILRILKGFMAVLPAEEIQAKENYKDIDRKSLTDALKNRAREARAELEDHSDLAELVRIWIKLKDLIGSKIELPGS